MIQANQNLAAGVRDEREKERMKVGGEHLAGSIARY